MSQLTLTLRQPAQIGDQPRKENLLATLGYLPGSVVRGAFAASWISSYGPPTPGNPRRAGFLDLFEGGVRFGTLLPEGTEIASLAVLTHKYPKQTCDHAEFDRAASDKQPPLRCKDCDSPLIQDRGLRGPAPARKRRTSVEIRADGVAEKGKLFTRETLAEGQEFRGTVTGDPALLAELASLGPVRIGGRRTTHGLATVSITEADPPAPQRRGDGRLILRLRSPAVFTDAAGRPAAEPVAEHLEMLFGTPVRVIRRWTRWQQEGGWHMASSLPKPAELAVAAGSAYLLESQRPVADDILARIAQHGIGLRRLEGYGDLAPPPELIPGASDRRAEQERLARLMDDFAPLRGISVRWPDRWPALRTAMARHADGDAAATRLLAEVDPAVLDAGTVAALRAFTRLPAADARYVLEALGVR